MKQVRCPLCGRTLFWSKLPWLACPERDDAAIVSVRCTRKWRCGAIIYLRILAVPRTAFEHPETRQATIAALKDAVELD